MNPWAELSRAIAETREMDRAAGQYANAMAELLRGRLHRVDTSTLRALKRELRGFNMTTGQWEKK